MPESRGTDDFEDLLNAVGGKCWTDAFEPMPRMQHLDAIGADIVEIEERLLEFNFLVARCVIEANITTAKGADTCHLSVKHLWDYKRCERRRFSKKRSPLGIDVVRLGSYDRLEERYFRERRTISKSTVDKLVKRLGMRKERLLEDRIVCKGLIRDAVAKINTHLEEIAVANESDNARMIRSELGRATVIADLLNWIFRDRYFIKADYSAEHVRKLLKTSRKGTAL